jgi:uncharacterized protein YjbI with pentapeptide repeats
MGNDAAKRPWYRSRGFTWIAIGVLSLAAVAGIYFLVAWVSPADPDDKINFVTTIAQLVGGFALLSGLIFTYYTVRSAQDTLELQREGQVTDRFSRAVGQLESTDESVRVGAILSLERIAHDSERDRLTSWTVILNFIRSRRLAYYVQERGGKDKANDVQTALDALSRLGEIVSDKGKSRANDLSGTVLTDAKLMGGSLRNVEFTGAWMNRSYMVNCDMAGVLAYKTHFDDAVFAMTPLQHANFSGAVLKDAMFFYPTVDKQKYRAIVNDAEAVRQMDEKIKFFGGDVSARGGMELNGGQLLDGLDLMEADLTGTDLRFADLRLVRNLTQEQLDSALTGDDTMLPDYLSQKT